ncbi:hypothetical protein BGZ94_008544 [Podila epigama]|nr:hypothetical protein BGZ94_008544 [Podila epigama]
MNAIIFSKYVPLRDSTEDLCQSFGNLSTQAVKIGTKEVEVLDHVHHAYEWERDGHKLNEPRLGRRFTIVADIQTPSGPLLCYCAHLEVFTGIIGRISAISDILADSELYSERYPYQILFGDLNTISHSIARLAKTISTDQYRIGSIGFQEAEWWDHNLWSWHVEDGEFNLSLATGGWSWLRRFGVLGIGISSALLHAGTKDSGETRSGFWHSDRKYSNWLRMLVQAGLDKVKLARQQQLTVDSLVTVEKNNQNWHNRHGCISQLAAVEAVSTSNTALTDSKQTTDESMDDLASERSYQEDGSMVLIGRPRSPSIITLESSLLDKNESMSTSSWPLPTSPIGYNDHSHENGESEDEDNVLVHVYDTTIQRKKQSKAKGTSSPSTPSPTLRLIPPTPKERRSLAQGEEGDEIYYNEEERGVVLHYGKGESDTEEEDDGEEHGSWRRNARRNANDNDNDHSYDHSYDHNVFTTKNTTRATTMTTTTTTTTTTTATTTAAIALMAKMSEKEDSQQTSKEDQRSRHYPFDQEHEYKQTKEEHGEETPTKTETFQDPQPPFLLSTLSHATLGTRRLWSGFTPLVLHQARNPGFYDPWSARDDLTLHNPNFFGILKAKLDYTLLMNLRCVSREMGNHDYSASDHKWLLVEVEFERQFRTGHDDDDQRVPANNDDDDGVDDNDDNGIAVHTKDSSERVYELPSRTQRYLWWRERRHEWDQTVQPHPSATRPGYAKRTKDLYRQNPLLQQHRRQQQQQQQQQQEKNLSDTRSNVISGTSLMTAAVAVVVGGLFWWHKK